MLYNTLSKILIIAATLCAVCSCTSVRTEFYREETSYLYSSACDAYKERDFEKAGKEFSAIIEIDPSFAQAYAGLGNIALVENDLKSAAGYYLQAMGSNPDFQQRLLPIYLSMQTASARQNLGSVGLSLARIQELLLSDQLYAVEAEISEETPLELLAADSVSLTPTELGELRKQIVQCASEVNLSPSLSLLFACILFVDHTYDSTTMELLHTVTTKSTSPRQAQAYLYLGRVYKRLGKTNEAIKSLASAIELGTPIEDAAPFLAPLYKQTEEAIIERHNQPRMGYRLPDPGPFSRTRVISAKQPIIDKN